MKVIRESGHTDHVRYFHHFDYEDEPGWGFAFDCNAAGKLTNPGAAQKNYDACLTGEVDGKKVIDKGVRETKWTSFICSLIKCHCGAEVELSTNSNCCDECGAWYNMSGQVLVAPCHWGEETGETPAEIIMSVVEERSYDDS